IKENPKEFIATVEGVGKLLVQNAKDYKSFKEILESEIYPCCYLKDNRIVLATLLKGIEPKEFKEKIEFQSYSEMVNYYIEKNHMTNSQEKLFHQISNTVKKRMKKLERTLLNIEQDNLQKSDYEINREIGDILAANIYQLKKNMPQVTLYNFYRNSNMEIELNTAHTIQKNIDSYYKKYNKLKRGLVSNERRIVEVRSEIEYLESTLALATAIQTPENLKNIQTELENQGYLKVVKKGNPKGKKKVRTDNFAVYEEGENYKIIYGRNNSENDFVTFKLGDKDDFWFHAKDIPGSHVILKVNRGYLSDELIEKAARVALIYSKSEIGHRVTVEYTQRKFVSKPKGARPGAVIYTNHREISFIK
ncbi:MAG: NFACT RNA binding domain-containing protein, partial [Fusobacteriaceae bacterium]